MELLELSMDMAKEAGAIVRDRYKTEKSWKIKTSRADIVTEVDEAVEGYLLDRLKEARPDDSVLSEESGWSGTDNGRFVWIIDPIDGTTNYAIGLPFFSISIAVSQNGLPLAGVVYDPLHDEMFYGQTGKGAFMNGSKILASAEQRADAGLISVSWVKGKSDSEIFVDIIRELSRHTSQFRRFGSAALGLCYVANGRLNGFIQSGLNPWDVAAAQVILREAGAQVTDFHRQPVSMRNPDIDIVAGNEFFHSLLLDALDVAKK